MNERYRYVSIEYRGTMLSVYFKKSETVFEMEKCKPEPNLNIFQDFSSRR
jgi:hypothetical protein